MKASIHIVVVLCVVIKQAHQTNNTKLANSDFQHDINNRARRHHDSTAIKFPSKCNRAILSCCADTEQHQKKCFSNFRCAQTYDNGKACAKETILKVLDSYDIYATNNEEDRRKRWTYDRTQPRLQSRSELNPNQQEEYLPQIVRLLEEITTYVRKPQTVPVPQAIYVPYPVPYPVPQWTQQTKEETAKVPNIRLRGFPEPDATTWGVVKTNEGDEKDGARPISFVPIKPDKPLRRQTPSVEHGSVQEDVKVSISSPGSVTITNRTPAIEENPCVAAILACCAENVKTQQSNCFYGFQCGIPYDNGNACKFDSIKTAVASYQSTNLG